MANLFRMVRKTLKRGTKVVRNVGERSANVVRRVGKVTRKTLRRGTNTLGLTKKSKSRRHRSRKH
jgi:hypothetical protein